MLPNKWVEWAEQETGAMPEKRPLNSRPVPFSTASPSSSSALTFIDMTIPDSSLYVCDITPTKQQIDIILPYPVQCFCRKPAHRNYTHEYGPILVCSNFRLDPATISEQATNTFVCAFHVHESSWTKFCDTVKTTNRVHVHYPEFRSCPLYNFTFRAIFSVSNKYAMEPPVILPDCFCNKPAVMRISKKNNSISFVCMKRDIDGAKKCSWALDALEAPFLKPKFDIHNSVSYGEYMAKRYELLKQVTVQEQQRNFPTTLPRPSNNTDAVPFLKAKLQQLKTTVPATTGPNLLFVPTSVLRKRPTSKPVLSGSSLATSPVISLDTNENEEQKRQSLEPMVRYEFDQLEMENNQLKSVINTLVTENKDMASKVDRLKDKVSDLQKELSCIKRRSDEENKVQ